MNTLQEQMEKKWALIVFSIIFIWCFFRVAWITEDAFINFRVIENFRIGYGLVWNPGERVQVFTSPLWMLVTLGASLLTGEIIYTVILLSFVLVASTILLLYMNSGKSAVVFLAVGSALLISSSITDYSSSGLETPLLMFTVGLFTHIWYQQPGGSKSTLYLMMVAGICVLVRHDSMVITLPLLLQQIYATLRPYSNAKFWLLFKQGLLAALPVIIWSVFSILYFGSPLPNTARAKIVHGFDGFNQTLQYLEFMQHFDPIVYVIISVTIFVAFSFKNRCRWPLLGSLLLFIIYLCYVGADYMAGRFFVGPLILCIFLLAGMLHTHIVLNPTLYSFKSSFRRKLWLFALIIPVMAYGVHGFTARNSADFIIFRFVNGIIDERAYYNHSADLESIAGFGVQHKFRDNAEIVNQAFDEGVQIVVACNIGILGYFAVRDLHIIDPLALSDVFLAGLPIRERKQRIGHFERSLPGHYALSLLNNRNEFTNPVVREYYDDVVLVTRAPLFSPGRIGALFRISTGYYTEKLEQIDFSEMGGELLLESDTDISVYSCLGGQTNPMTIVLDEYSSKLILIKL